MTKYLISFPSAAMDVPLEELPAVADAAHAVVREAQAAGVWVFGGGIDESVPPVVVDGGYSILDLPSHEAAVEWGAKFATACRCPQEIRAFGDDAEA